MQICAYGGERVKGALTCTRREWQLQLDPDLTLEKTKKMVRQREAVHEQQLVLKEEPTTTLDEMRANQGASQGYSKRKYPKQCSQCGGGQHPWEKCPA